MNMGSCRMVPESPTARAWVQKVAAQPPVPAGRRSGGEMSRSGFFQGCPVRLGSLAVRVGGQELKVGPWVSPAPTNPFVNPFRKAFHLLNQIPAIFHVLPFTAGSEASQTRSALGASCLPKPWRADRASGLNQIPPGTAMPLPGEFAPDFFNASLDQFVLLRDGGEKGFPPLVLSSPALTLAQALRCVRHPWGGSWQPLHCSSLGRKGGIVAA